MPQINLHNTDLIVKNQSFKHLFKTRLLIRSKLKIENEKHLLKQDSVLEKVLPEVQKIAFRKATKVRSIIAPSHLINGPGYVKDMPTFLNMVGSYKCKCFS